MANDAAILEILRGIAAVAPIDQLQLAVDAHAVLTDLGGASEDHAWRAWRDIVNVDAPELDDSKVEALNLDFDLVELCFSHGSGWIARLAVFLFVNAANPARLRLAIDRVVVKNGSYTMWAAAHMAEALGAETATNIACNRLQGDVVSGCEHLFDLLLRLNARPGAGVVAAISNALMANDEDVAIAAARLTNAFEPPPQDLLPIVIRSYEHWLKEEKPYPSKGGIVPRSPRDVLLSVRLKLEPASVGRLLEFAEDKRPDVVRVAETALQSVLRESAPSREQFVSTILANGGSMRLLRQALNTGIPFVAADVERLLVLLDSDDPSVRFSAMGLLDERYLQKDRAVAFAIRRIDDDEQEIKDAAYRVVERFSAGQEIS